MQPELDEDAAGVGRELQAGADFLEALGLLQHDNPEALRGKRQGSRQASDPGPGDEDGARNSHG